MSTITYCEILSTRRSTLSLSKAGGKRERSQLGERRSHAHFLRALFSTHRSSKKCKKQIHAEFRVSLHPPCKEAQRVSLSFWETFSNHPLARKWLRKESFVGTSSAEDDLMLFCVKNKQISLRKRFGNWKLHARAKNIRLLLNRKDHAGKKVASLLDNEAIMLKVDAST